MNQPQIIHTNYIDTDTHTQDKYGAWVPARPLPHYHSGLNNLLNRLRLAWLVFMGRCDALQWGDNDSANTQGDTRPNPETASSDLLGCTCRRCIEEGDLRNEMGLPLSSGMMIVCPECGNKRCPKASDHRLTCTKSNQPGQAGSVYT